jgi:hypothetical protein
MMQANMAKLTFTYGNRPVPPGLEVAIHWEGYSSWTGRAHTHLHTDDSGSVHVDDSLIDSTGSRPERIWVRDPEGGSAVYYVGIWLSRGRDYEFPIEAARRQ